MKYFLKPNTVIISILIMCISLLCMSFPTDCRAEEPDTDSNQIIVFVSKNIRPYIEAVDGLREMLDKSIVADVTLIMLDRYAEKARDDLANQFAGETNVDLVAAIGPEAAAFAWKTFQGPLIPKVYAIILNPEKVIDDIDSATGISLNIPPGDQLHVIRKVIPSARRIGIFYDPAHNSDFFASASAAALEQDADIVPMAVSSRKDIPFLLEQCWDSVDCIWLIPDRTVISESIAQYIIKQSILHKVPVVGYNRFFYDSGAAMAFVFDYKALGSQAAGVIADVMQQKATGSRTPVFNVWLNETVLEKLNIEIRQPLTLPMMVSP